MSPKSIFISVLLLGASTGIARAEEPEFGLLVDEPGAEDTFAYCTACHSELIIAQQGKSRQHWDDALVWMEEEQGMFEIDEPERTEILDYLAAHYNVDRPNFPDQWILKQP